MVNEIPRRDSVQTSAGHYKPTLILIGGGAASGKSRISIELAQLISNAVLLDKDSLFGVWVDALLYTHGRPTDRDCTVYWDYIRPLEYKCLERLAYDHLQLGKVVVIDAPLRPELNDPAWVDRINCACQALGAKLIAVWVEVSPECAHQRMRQRSESRDKWKLENWNEFVRRQSYSAPCAANLVLQNDGVQPESAASIIIASLSPILI